jgi:hypothetical protein
VAKLIDDELELELELTDIELELDELDELELDELELDAKNSSSKYGLRVLSLFSLVVNFNYKTVILIIYV